MTLDEMRLAVEGVASQCREDDNDVALAWAQTNIETLARVLMELIDHVDPNCMGTIESLADFDDTTLTSMLYSREGASLPAPPEKEE